MADKTISLALLKRSGVSLRIYCDVTGEEKIFDAFLQPLRYKNKLYINHRPTELGFDTFQKFLLITSPDVPLEKIDDFIYKLYFGETRLKIDHYEKIYHGNEPFYYWSVVSKEVKP